MSNNDRFNQIKSCTNSLYDEPLLAADRIELERQQREIDRTIEGMEKWFD